MPEDRAERILRRLPSPMTLYVIALGAVLFAITIAKGVQDPDFFWHVTTGELIASTGSVPTTDPFSFTWAGNPWTLHEWLSELLMHALLTTIGDVATLVLFATIPVAIVAILAWALARQGVSVQGFVLASLPAVFVLVPYLTVRPQALSWLLLAILIALLLELRPDRPALALVLAPFFAVWANLHGLWVIGLGVVALYALFTLAGRTPMAAARGWMVAGVLGALVAAALTPAGPAGLLYPLRYVDGGDWGLANIREWQSPDFHDPVHLGLLVLIVLLLLNGGRGAPGWVAALSWVGAVLGLLAARNSPLAALFALPALAFGAQARLEGWLERRRGPTRPRLKLGRRLMEAGLAMVVALAAFMITLPGSAGLEPDPSRFPVAAVQRLEGLDPDARVLAEYGWGGYVISRLYPSGGRVFVDGRNDMYDEATLDAYSALRAAEGDWAADLDRWRVDAILLPPAAPLVDAAVGEAGWCEVHRDDLSVLLQRSCT